MAGVGTSVVSDAVVEQRAPTPGVDPVVEMVSCAPAPGLRHAVAEYLGYRQDWLPPGIHRGLPSGSLTFIISLDEPVEALRYPDGRQAPSALQALVGGLHAAPAVLKQPTRQQGVAVQLRPAGCRALFGLPAGALAWSVVDLRDLLGPSATGLVDRLVSQHDWAGRFAVLDEVLLARARSERRQPARAEIAWAWQRLVRSGGGVGVAELAGEVGWSRRHFGERFRLELGLSPKVAARVLRFDRAVRLLRDPSRRPAGLADLAVQCGYYDQAHLAGEWREFAGCTLTTWLAEELPVLMNSGFGGYPPTGAKPAGPSA